MLKQIAYGWANKSNKKYELARHQLSAIALRLNKLHG
jgi:hypothetical protein